MKTLPPEEVMYKALLERDASFVGVFVVGVKTTGIFCRPTCAARKPRRENVEYFADAHEALHAGYRPCKKCRPLEHAGAAPDDVQALLEEVEASPGLHLRDADLRRRNLDPSRVRRFFKRHYGMTFHAYQRARRMGAAFASLRSGGDILTTGAEHGFASASGFHDAFKNVIGTTPGAARNGTEYGIARTLFGKWIDTPLGGMFAVADDEGLCMLEFVDRRGLERELEALRRRLRAQIVPGEHNYLAKIKSELEQYYAGRLQTFTTKLHLVGSDFQIETWRELQRIPYGETRSYAQMAKNVGRPGAHRAVGRANGMNQIAIVVPCHRVIRSDGQLAGYGGGKWRKQRLLELEGAIATS